MTNLLFLLRTDPLWLVVGILAGLGLYYAAKLLLTVLLDYWRGERLLRRWREKGWL